MFSGKKKMKINCSVRGNSMNPIIGILMMFLGIGILVYGGATINPNVFEFGMISISLIFTGLFIILFVMAKSTRMAR